MIESTIIPELHTQINQATVTGLFYYPIKSCRGIAMEQAEVGPTGIAHDREFMLVEQESGLFLTQREQPRMALISPTIEGGGDILRLRAPGMADLTTEIVREGSRRQVKVWRDECQVISQGTLVAEWLSEFLGLPCQLNRMAEDFQRMVNRDYARRESDHVSFADGFPLLLISEESLADLNNRLEIPLPMNRFRPNVVISGHGLPFAEDQLDQVRFGQLEFDVVKPCIRCPITTTNQETTERGKEPLKTLATFRRDPKSGGVMFGQNIIPATFGTLHLGDSVEVLSLRQQVLAFANS